MVKINYNVYFFQVVATREVLPTEWLRIIELGFAIPLSYFLFGELCAFSVVTPSQIIFSPDILNGLLPLD